MSTRPSFFRDGRAGIKPEWVGPWCATTRQIDELRKRVDAERDPARRRTLELEYNGLLAKAAQANPTGIVPLTFAERVLLEERQRRLPELYRIWLETMDELMYWTAGDQGALVEQANAEFTRALFDLLAPLAKAYGLDLKKAGAKSVTERIAELDQEIADLRKQLAGLERKREPLVAEKEKEKPSKIPNAM